MSVRANVNYSLVRTTLVVGVVLGLGLIADFSQAKTVGHVIRDIKKERSSLPPQGKREKPKTTPTNVNLRAVRPVTTKVPLQGTQGNTNEAEFEKYLDQQIQQLYKLSEKTKSKDFRGDIWLRLAKAYTEKATLVEKRVNEKYDQDLRDYLAKKNPRKPRLDLTPAQSYNKKAIQLYKWYLGDHPKGKNTDQVLFFLGYNSMALNDNALGIKYYEKLAKEYPRSEFLTEANLSLADYYFDIGTNKASNNQKEFLLAEKYYKEVVKGRSRLTPIANYKLAWVNLKLGRPKNGLIFITRIIRDGRSSDERMAAAKNLAKEAQKELPMFYSQVGEYDKAVPYFKALLPPADVDRSLEGLAMLYTDAGNRDGANYIFDYLSQRSKLSDEKIFDFQHQKVQMAESKGGVINAKNEIFALVQKFGPRSAWGKKNANKDFYKSIQGKMESTLKNYTLEAHKLAQKDNDVYKMKAAEEGYRIYDANYSSIDEKGEMRFFYAELLYDMQDYYKASELYRSLAKKPGNAFASKAELNALLSIEKILPTNEEIKAKVGNSTEVLKLNPVEEKFKSYAEDYLKNPNNKENRVEVMYKLASMLYAHNYLNEAEKSFKQINKEHPNTKYSEYATNLILDIYNLKGDYKGLEKAGTEILESKATNNEAIVNDVKSVVEKSAFKNAEQVEKEGDHIKAARAYLEFYKKYPKSDLAWVAVYNAAINFEKADKKLLAIEAYERLIQIGPKTDEKVINGYLYIGVLKESLTDFAGAVQDYEKYLMQVKPEQVNADLYYNIAVIYEALKDFNKAQKFFNLYIANSKEASKNNILFRLAEYAEQLDLYNDAVKNYETFVNAPGGSADLKEEAIGRLAHLYRRANQITKSKQYFDRAVALQKASQDKKSSGYAAEALFMQTEEIYKNLRGVTISANPAKQQGEVQKKIQLVEELRKASEKVIALDSPEWIVAALTRMGQGYQHLAFALVSAPTPKDLTPEELKEYQGKIAEIAAPFKNNAIMSYEKALERAKSLNGYGPFYAIARAELYNIAPEKTYYAQEDVFVMEMYDTTLPNDKVFKALNPVMGDEVALKKELEKILETDSKNGTAHEMMAQFYFGKKLYHLAALYLERIKESTANSPRVINNMGLIKFKLNDKTTAQKQFEKALKVDPDHEPANINAIIKYLEQDGLESAGSNLEILYGKNKSKLKKADKKAVEIAINYGVSLSRQGSFEGGAKIYSSVIAEYPSDVSAQRNLAINLITGQKKKDQGAEVLEKYKSLASKKKDFDTIKVLEGALQKL